jgi:competence protein ComEA
MGDLMRPAPRRSLVEHAIAVLRWIGVGRVVAIGGSVLAVAAGSVWLLRTPESAGTDHARPGASAAVPTLPTSADAPLPEPASPPTMPGDPSASTAAPAPAPATSTPRLVVHVAGAVAAPAVYELAPGSRVADAVGAAGGATPDAALDAVNLAAPVADGQQIYVPRVGDAAGPAPPVAPSPTGSAPAPGPIDLNTASEQELLALPGVGPVLAAAIVRHREEAGPFTTVDGLLDVSGIGPARLESLRELVRV